jgi:hypothetical protein
MLYKMDKWIREILHTLTLPFENIDIFFCGDLHKSQPMKDSWIFEEPSFFHEKILQHNFYKDDVKHFEIKQGMRQEKFFFISILTRIITCSQTKDDIIYLNRHCYRNPSNDPIFPYLFHKNIYV